MIGFKIFIWHPQGDSGENTAQELLDLLRGGWEIKASNTVNEGIYYILYKSLNIIKE